MQETILIARERKTGKDVVLVGRDAGYPAQRDKYFEFESEVNEEYSHVAICNLVPVKKPLKFITADEKQARAAKVAAATPEPTKAEKPSPKTTKPKK